MRVGFLYNHDQIHQIAHSLPIALALRETPGVEVVLAATNERIEAEIGRLAGPVPVEPLRLRSTANRLAARTVGKLLPAQKLLVYRDNLDFFRSLDALVVSERTSLVLKSRYGLDLPMILADHGAGDRAIGFNAETARFDLILAAGPKIRDRLVAESGADPAKIVITGYPKFDLARRAPLDLPFLGNGRPTVLYNPHVSPHLSSWYGMGRQVLDFFLSSDAYNLIFAPHIMLFERRIAASIDKLRVARPGRLDPKYARAPHIHVDLGSRASTDMSYTDAADLYLGDVSSQIYEFLRRHRPALFLNPHLVEWEGDPNYAHWQAGRVIEDAGQLEAALRASMADHKRLYEPVQRKLFDYTFDLTGEPSGVRAARAIRAFLGLGHDG